MMDNRIKIETEKELHHKVVKFVRKRYPEALMIAGLGENQRTTGLRISAWKKGYSAGQCDLMLMNPTRKYSALCLEFKSPIGKYKIFDKQLEKKHKYKRNRCKYVVSNSFDDCLFEIVIHMEKSRKFVNR